MKTQVRTQPFVDKVVRLISHSYKVTNTKINPADEVGDMVYIYIDGFLNDKKQLLKQIKDLAFTDNFHITIKSYKDAPNKPCIWFCLHSSDYVPMDESVSSE